MIGRAPAARAAPGRQEEAPMGDLALLLLRVVTGGLLAGHGAQKLFGWFGGYGLQGTGGWLESIGMKPGVAWAALAGGGEIKGGLLTVLGLGGPLGSILSISAMAMAWIKGHAGKPIWNTEGGAELPLINITAATTLMLTGPGRYSLDHLLGIRIPTWLSVLTALGAAGTIAAGALMQPEPEEPAVAEETVGAGAV
jgi:putative oxidoreductase